LSRTRTCTAIEAGTGASALSGSPCRAFRASDKVPLRRCRRLVVRLAVCAGVPCHREAAQSGRWQEKSVRLPRPARLAGACQDHGHCAGVPAYPLPQRHPVLHPFGVTTISESPGDDRRVDGCTGPGSTFFEPNPGIAFVLSCQHPNALSAIRSHTGAGSFNAARALHATPIRLRQANSECSAQIARSAPHKGSRCR
jgi:hypothetical protein